LHPPIAESQAVTGWRLLFLPPIRTGCLSTYRQSLFLRTELLFATTTTSSLVFPPAGIPFPFSGTELPLATGAL
jgi:hypothetical protein